MAQQLQAITIAAPGFYGLNTQDSPVDQQPRFASVALNCVIDQYGRVGARKGYSYLTTDATEISGGDGITAIYEYTASTGSQVVLSAGNNKILSGTTTLVDETPASYTITSENWKIVELNKNVYFFQRDYEPLVYQESTGTVVAMSAATGASGTPPEANEALAAFGKLFVADFVSDKSTVYWSDTLAGSIWDVGSSGSIDVTNVWPHGYDEIVALAQHNNFLVIFGRRSILIYGGVEDPSTMVLSDAIDNVGCIARDSVQNTGSDIIFLAENGVMSLARVIQEKSAPMRDISKNVRNDLVALLRQENSVIKSIYSAEEAVYLLSLPTTGYIYCFDMRGMLEDGSHRATLWDSLDPLCFHVNRDGDILIGKINGIAKYTGYLDDSSTYEMQYYSNPISFGNASMLKFLKKIAMTIIGGSGVTAFLKWAYDYKYDYKSVTYTLSGGAIAEYNTAQYNVDEFTSGVIITRPSINSSGSGYVVTVGLTSNINGAALSIQQIDVLALLGRVI